MQNLDPSFNIVIDVPYESKDEAKRIGARWDPKSKYWFVRYRLGSDGFYGNNHNQQTKFKYIRIVDDNDCILNKYKMKYLKKLNMEAKEAKLMESKQ